MSDDKLASGLKKGDIRIFEEVFYLYKDKIYNFSYRLLACADTSKEVVQETMVRLWENKDKLEPSKSLNGYIYAIARNLVNDHMTAYARHGAITVQEVGLASTYAGAIEQISYEEIKKIEQEVVNQLPPKQKEVYELSRYDQLSNPEIADSLGISVNSVKTHLRLALKSLREHLSPESNAMLIITLLLFKN
ncbi:RNA polymerase sigma-70 factor [Fulvivirga maritima]|uniref:RNA polymerase sigma factor n=1 Tax=Fulvivirga maritima TaxID=2904247 RepID=UPI001F45268A|nr:RNA polymerase sigma-70 factor [Fulvivirga maritima]UII26420.1 RNA polymerase sigma-70 factor [Fulvivirga maritima]